jgi:hypothetical protein
VWSSASLAFWEQNCHFSVLSFIFALPRICYLDLVGFLFNPLTPELNLSAHRCLAIFLGILLLELRVSLICA